VKQMRDVDVVVVTYNSRHRIQTCLEPLLGSRAIHVFVVDNASSDDTVDVLDGLAVMVLPQVENRGFGAGCNVGWRAGRSPYVLFLNPDAAIDPASVGRLKEVLDGDASVGIVGPKITTPDGRIARSLRRFPRLPSTLGRALFLHRLFPRSGWASEIVGDPAAYERAGTHEWISGACLMARRPLLERLGGFDEGYFMYCEDKDLCKRASDAGFATRYEPAAECIHEEGGSSSRDSLRPVLAASRLRYAAKHFGAGAALLHRWTLVAEALFRLVAARGGIAARRGHGRALRVLLAPTKRPRANAA
jgi:N-acetylglucosaminyl-diphospho-decaprenol L-rhamnosyltransferase